jgi:hypothetical protein
MRTHHRLRVVPESGTSSAQVADFAGGEPSAKPANGHGAPDQESAELEQLRQSLANASASDRRALLAYFGRLARFVLAVKCDPEKSE